MLQVARIATGSQFNSRSAPIPRKGIVLTLAATWWVWSYLGIGFGQKVLTGVSCVCHTVATIRAHAPSLSPHCRWYSLRGLDTAEIIILGVAPRDRRVLYARELGNWAASLFRKPLSASCLICTVCSASIAR